MIDRVFNRRMLLVAAVLVLVVGGVSVAATTNVYWITTATDSDFEDAELTNFEIVGSGSSASVDRPAPDEGSTVDLEDHTHRGNAYNDGGWVIEPKEDIAGFEIKLGRDDTFDTVEIRRMSDNQLIASKNVENAELVIRANLNAGEQYRIVALGGGENSQGYDNADFPEESADFDLVAGWDGSDDTTTTGWAANIELAQAYTGHQYDSAEYINTYDVTDPEDGRIVIGDVVDMEITAQWQYHDGNDWQTAASETITSTGTYERDVSEHEADEWRIVLSADATGSDWRAWTMSMDSEAFSVENSAPSIHNETADPSDEELVTESPVELSIDISDPDFDSSQGDEVTATAYLLEGDSPDPSSDTEIGSETITENSTVTVEWDDPVSGDIEYYWVAEDSYDGKNQSEVFKFETPNDLQIRDEMDQELITGTEANVTVRFFREDSEEVITRTTDDGVVDLSGLPLDAEFIVSANADGYEPRRIIIDNILDQQTIYLLPENEPSVFNEFILQDDTGDFPDSNTKLIIKKSISKDDDNETQTFQTIAGDYFGATGTFPVVLAAQDRYRLIIENAETGERRAVGSYVAESEGTEPIRVGQITWPEPDQMDWGFSATYEEEDEQDRIRVKFNDSTGETEELEITIHERHNKSNVIYKETVNNPAEYSAVVPLEGNQTTKEWAVSYNTTRHGETSSHTYIVGGAHEIEHTFDTEWVGLLAMFGLVVMLAAFPGPLAPVGGVAVVGVSGALILLGLLNVPLAAWFIAGMIAVLGLVKSSQEVRFG